MLKKIQDWWFRKRLKWRKQKLLHEVMLDIKFIERNRPTDETNLRAELSAERQKEEPNQARIDKLSGRISDLQATAEELRNLKRTAEEMPKYIEML